MKRQAETVVDEPTGAVKPFPFPHLFAVFTRSPAGELTLFAAYEEKAAAKQEAAQLQGAALVLLYDRRVRHRRRRYLARSA